MAATATPGAQIVSPKPRFSASNRIPGSKIANFSHETKGLDQTKLSSLSLSATQLFSKSYNSNLLQSERRVIKAMSSSSDKQPLPGLPVDLRGKRAFIAGIADDNGYGWAIAKSLAAAGAEILVGTWVPALNIFETSLRRGKFDESRVLPDGSLMEITKVYPLDAVFDCPEDVPEDIKENKRYAGSSNWTVKEVAETVKQDFGTIDILVHSLANGPEVIKPLLETSRYGYLAAISASSYSFVSLLKHFVPIMNPGGATISLTYIASEKIIPGYGGGMSSAKSALESDSRVLAFEAGRKHNIRVNTISAPPPTLSLHPPLTLGMAANNGSCSLRRRCSPKDSTTSSPPPGNTSNPPAITPPNPTTPSTTTVFLSSATLRSSSSPSFTASPSPPMPIPSSKAEPPSTSSPPSSPPPSYSPSPRSPTTDTCEVQK